MPKPLRIKYKDAIYHVMNRGRGHQLIFHNDDYYHAFLEALDGTDLGGRLCFLQPK